MASRGKQRRKDLRTELERRVAADGYKLSDIFPELGNGAASGRQRRKMPVKFRNPQNPDEAWTGIGRTPRWVQADPRRAGDRDGGVQVDSDVPGPRIGRNRSSRFFPRPRQRGGRRQGVRAAQNGSDAVSRPECSSGQPPSHAAIAGCIVDGGRSDRWNVIYSRALLGAREFVPVPYRLHDVPTRILVPLRSALAAVRS